jgi:hypothetical protein
MRRLETSRVELRKDRGIYIILHANPRVILQEVQGGFMYGRGIFLGGFKEDCQDTETDLTISGNPKGLNEKQPRASSSSSQMRRAARVAPLAGDSST